MNPTNHVSEAGSLSFELQGFIDGLRFSEGWDHAKFIGRIQEAIPKIRLLENELAKAEAMIETRDNLIAELDSKLDALESPEQMEKWAVKNGLSYQTADKQLYRHPYEVVRLIEAAPQAHTPQGALTTK